MAQGKAVFPNATLRLSQAEADYWLAPANKAAAPEFLASFFDSAVAAVAPYVAAGRFRRHQACAGNGGAALSCRPRRCVG